jgi:hypothetical protein
MDSADDAIGNSAMRNSLFMNNLEGWIDEIICQDGLTDKALVKTIKERFQRSMQANIDHHEFMMNNENGDVIRADRHKLMVEVYRSFSFKK